MASMTRLDWFTVGPAGVMCREGGRTGKVTVVDDQTLRWHILVDGAVVADGYVDGSRWFHGTWGAGRRAAEEAMAR